MFAGQGKKIGVGELLLAANLRHQGVIDPNLVRPEFVAGVPDPHPDGGQRIVRAGGVLQMRGDVAESKLSDRTGCKTVHPSKPLPGLAVLGVVRPRQGNEHIGVEQARDGNSASKRLTSSVVNLGAPFGT